MSYSLFVTLLVLSALQVSRAEIFDRVVCDVTAQEGDIYSYSAVPLNVTGNEQVITFDQYQGQVLLITNVATYNERTVETYDTLNQLVEMYAGQPFTVLGFPCTQFDREEPEASPQEFLNGLFYVRPGNDFVPNFQLFERIDINGGAEIEVYSFLKSTCSYTEDLFRTDLEYIDLNIDDVRHPFEKFLVDKSGKVQYRYHAGVSTVEELTPDIDALINA